jgi:hypothetical protein
MVDERVKILGLINRRFRLPLDSLQVDEEGKLSP